MLIAIGVLRYEIEVELGVVVYELEGRILCLLADGGELADETALLQLLQRFRELCIIRVSSANIQKYADKSWKCINI